MFFSFFCLFLKILTSETVYHSPFFVNTSFFTHFWQKFRIERQFLAYFDIFQHVATDFQPVLMKKTGFQVSHGQPPGSGVSCSSIQSDECLSSALRCHKSSPAPRRAFPTPAPRSRSFAETRRPQPVNPDRCHPRGGDTGPRQRPGGLSQPFELETAPHPSRPVDTLRGPCAPTR